VFGQWVGALQVGIVDARQLADVSKEWCASDLIKSPQLTLELPSKPIQTFHVLKPSAIRRARASEMNALNSLKLMARNEDRPG
jgi:hypothetical protein